MSIWASLKTFDTEPYLDFYDAFHAYYVSTETLNEAERGGMLDLALTGLGPPLLRVYIQDKEGDATVYIDRAQVTAVRDALTRWLNAPTGDAEKPPREEWRP